MAAHEHSEIDRIVKINRFFIFFAPYAGEYALEISTIPESSALHFEILVLVPV